MLTSPTNAAAIPGPTEDPPGALRREHALYAASLLGLGFIVLSRLIDPLRVNHDVAAFIAIARLSLRGATPFADYINLNPPLINYLHVIPAWIAERLGVHPVVAFSWLVIGLMGWTLLAVLYIARALEARATGVLMGAVAVFAVVLLSVKLTVSDSFGQREHLFILFYLPYVLLRWLRLHPHRPISPRLEIVLGLAAGVGLCIKPYFLILEVALEGFLFLRLRSLRKLVQPEILAVAVTGFAYALHFAFLPPDALAGIREVLGWLDSGGYRAYGDYHPLEIITSDLKTLGVTLAPFLFVHDSRGELGSLLRLSGVLTFASLVEAGWQARNFFYHGIPSWTFTYLIVLLAIFGYGAKVHLHLGRIWNRSTLSQAFPALLMVGIYGLLVVLFLGWSNIIGPADLSNLKTPETDPLVRAIEANSQPQSSVFVITTGTGLFRSVVQADRLVASKYFPDFPIAFALAGIGYGESLVQEPEAVPVAVLDHLARIEERIRQVRPDLIVVEGSPTCSGCPRGLNLAKLLGAMGFMERAILPDYTWVGDFDGDPLYRRSSGAAFEVAIPNFILGRTLPPLPGHRE